MKTESQEQIIFIQWCKRNAEEYPELDEIFAIPNGGKRHIFTASRMKLEGVKPGIPDLFLPVAKRGYHGLFIEMKKLNGTLSEAQKKKIPKLRAQGYAVIICKGAERAKALIKSYLNI